MADTHEYVNAEGVRHGTYAGTEVDAAFAASPDWLRDAEADGSGDADQVEDRVQTEEEGAEPESQPVEEDAEAVENPEESPVTDERSTLSRPELNDLARDAGIENPEALPTKAAVLEAIDAE